MRNRWRLDSEPEAGNVGRVVWCEGWLLGMWSVFLGLALIAFEGIKAFSDALPLALNSCGGFDLSQYFEKRIT